MGHKTVFIIEYKPEQYDSPPITITIVVKPSHRYIADDLKARLEKELEVYNSI